MRSFVQLLLAAVSMLAISACAFEPAGERDRQQAEASKALARGFDKDKWIDDRIAAQLAGARGDWAVSVALGEQSYREKPDRWTEFNLATAYQHTGQGALAVPLYIDLASRGRFTKIYPVQSLNGSGPPPMTTTMANEATRRLDQMPEKQPTARVIELGTPEPGVPEPKFPELGSH